MAGKVAVRRPVPKPLLATRSTPVEQSDGVRVALPMARLARYKVNIRSFHPNKNFEKLGFRFHGDNRGFSTGSSFYGNEDTPPSGGVTSRIWQRFDFDSASLLTGNVTKHADYGLTTESNTSAPGPHVWSLAGHEESYENKELKPRKKLEVLHANSPHDGQRVLRLKSWYGGENHAFRGSVTMQENTGVTHVPTLDVFGELFICIERVQGYMDICSLVYGDGFPNSEAFITDPSGKHLMLGTHVRIGAPATHLWGASQRLMWANALRVQIDTQGNFGERLWVFAQALGGPPSLRDDYPTNPAHEYHRGGAKPNYFSNPFNDSPPRFSWDFGRPEQITHPKRTPAELPLHLSAFVDLKAVRAQLADVWFAPPARQTTRSAWNDSQLYRNPNAGRAPDSYDLDPAKWQK